MVFEPGRGFDTTQSDKLDDFGVNVRNIEVEDRFVMGDTVAKQIDCFRHRLDVVPAGSTSDIGKDDVEARAPKIAVVRPQEI